MYLAVMAMLAPLMDAIPLLAATTIPLIVMITTSVLKTSVILNCGDVGTNLLMNSDLVKKDTVIPFSDGSNLKRTAMTTIIVLMITVILLAKVTKSANMNLLTVMIKILVPMNTVPLTTVVSIISTPVKIMVISVA